MEKYGWLVYNGSLNSNKFNEINNMYKQASSKKNIKLDLIKNNDIYNIIDKRGIHLGYSNAINRKPNFILFMDKDIALAKSLEIYGYKVFNSANTIELCDNKIYTYLALSKKQIKIPKTIISPIVYNLTQEKELLNFIESELGFPLIIKEAYGSFGDQVYLIENFSQLIEKRNILWNTPHLYQEFIKSSIGVDVRVNVVGNEVVAYMLRKSNKSFKSNISNGGTMYNVNFPKSFLNLAIEASKCVGADFSGVDLLFDNDKSPIVCEINSNAHIKNIYECTKINVANYIIDYIEKKVYYA